MPAPDERSLPPLRDVIRRHGLDADKRLGQHFLLDPSILGRIVRAAGDIRGRTVVEIGPGPGGLTRAILAAGPARLVAIEKDPRCLDALAELAQVAPALEAVNADALDYDLARIGCTDGLVLIANLPYNVGTALLIGWLQRIELFHSLTLLFQREVAHRITAEANTSDWGRLAVLAQSLCAAKRLFDLPAAAFIPPPKVRSTLVRLEPLSERPSPAEIARLETVTRAAFGQRRKMLRSSLRGLEVQAEVLLERAAISGTRRAETLSIEEFQRLARALGAGGDRG